MPVKKQDATQKADDCEKRAVELADQDDVEACSRAMLCNTWTIRHIMSKLRNLGVTVDEYRGKAGKEKLAECKRSQVEAIGSATAQGRAKRAKTLEDKGQDAVDDVKDMNGEVVPVKLQVPSKYWRLGDMTPTYLGRDVLPEIEDVSLSEANIKAKLIQRGIASQAQETMLEILEMMTGWERTHALTKQFRIKVVFIDEAKRRNQERGRRCAALKLPPNWNDSGLYIVAVFGVEVQVQHRFTQKKVMVHAEALMPRFTDGSNLYIHKNYSETYAMLKSREDSEDAGLPLRPLFTAQLTNAQLALRADNA